MCSIEELRVSQELRGSPPWESGLGLQDTSGRTLRQVAKEVLVWPLMSPHLPYKLF